VYHRHAVLLEHILEPLSENKRLSLENMLKLLGRHAETTHSHRLSSYSCARGLRTQMSVDLMRAEHNTVRTEGRR